MRPNGLEHAINGWWDRFRPGEQVRPASALSLSARGRSVTVPSRLLEGEHDSLDDAAREVSRATMGALQKQIRADGFKGATVSGFSGPDAGGRPAAGFMVRYGGNEYAFAIEEVELAQPGKYSALKGNLMQRNARATIVDTTAARELDLYIANTYELVGAPNSIGKSIDANLRRKLEKGTYDSARAPQAWQHLVDEGAKRYQREFGSGSPIFNAATRRQVADDFARAWEEENKINSLSNSQVQEDDYVMTVVDRDGRIGVYCIKRDGQWRGPLVSPTASSDAIERAVERDARDRGVHAAAVFEYEDGTRGLRQVGNVVGGRYQESGDGHQRNGSNLPEDPDSLARWAVRQSLGATAAFGDGQDWTPRACVIGKKDQARAGGRYAVLHAIRGLPGLLSETRGRNGAEFDGGSGSSTWRIVVV